MTFATRRAGEFDPHNDVRTTIGGRGESRVPKFTLDVWVSTTISTTAVLAKVIKRRPTTRVRTRRPTDRCPSGRRNEPTRETP